MKGQAYFCKGDYIPAADCFESAEENKEYKAKSAAMKRMSLKNLFFHGVENLLEKNAHQALKRFMAVKERGERFENMELYEGMALQMIIENACLN